MGVKAQRRKVEEGRADTLKGSLELVEVIIVAQAGEVE
jgi:hypothetical protein